MILPLAWLRSTKPNLVLSKLAGDVRNYLTEHDIDNDDVTTTRGIVAEHQYHDDTTAHTNMATTAIATTATTTTTTATAHSSTTHYRANMPF
jgi:hypothetical protein